MGLGKEGTHTMGEGVWAGGESWGWMGGIDQSKRESKPYKNGRWEYWKVGRWECKNVGRYCVF
jgi:hypothetical protein